MKKHLIEECLRLPHNCSICQVTCIRAVGHNCESGLRRKVYVIKAENENIRKQYQNKVAEISQIRQEFQQILASKDQLI